MNYKVLFFYVILINIIVFAIILNYRELKMKKNNKHFNNWISIVLLIIFLIIGRYYASDKNNNIANSSNVLTSANVAEENIENQLGEQNEENTNSIDSNLTDSNIIENANIDQSTIDAKNVDWNNEKLNIMFFYVGQADSSFIKLNDKCILIDAGNNGDGENIARFLKQSGINKIDYVIGTHCDEDHIGGIDEVINNLDIGQILMPAHGKQTANYKSVIKSAKNKGLKITNPNIGDKFYINDLEMNILSVQNNDDYSDNNSSIVTEIRYINNKFLFMGDAEKEIENMYKWPKVDVLKVGHHGSNTSSTERFLNQVKPTYSVIEVGKNNSYRLPNKYVIQRLDNIETTILRTDTKETSFWMTSDGNDIKVSEMNLNLDSE